MVSKDSIGMILAFLKLENGKWIEATELGTFRTIDEANDRLFSVLENKNDFWTKYKLFQKN